MSRLTDMTKGSPTKHLLLFALPLLVTNMGQQLYMIVDAAIVGRGVGVSALASVGATDWIYWLILWTATGLTQGFSTFVSRSFGEKNFEEMNKNIAMSALLCAAIGAFLTVSGLAAARPLLVLLNTPADIIGGAEVYLKTMIAGTLVVMAYNMAASILRGLGDGKTPLIAMVIAAFLNVGLDLLFVFVFKLGVFGAALASVMSQAVSFIYCLSVIAKVECIKINKKIFSPDSKQLRGMLVFGIPVAMHYVVLAVGGIILQSSINMQGSSFIAGYTATNKIYGLLESTATSLGLSASTFLAQNYGAGQYKRFKQGVRSSVIIVTATAAAVTSLVLVFRKSIVRIFVDVNEAGGAEALEVAARYLTIMVSLLVILYLIHIFINTLQAMEISTWSMVAGFAEFTARVVMAKIVINLVGADALFIAEPAAWLGSLICVLLPYLYYRRKLLSADDEKIKKTIDK